MKRGIHWVVEVYRVVLTPLRQTFGLYGCCRHAPTCSEYCRQAVEKYGYWRGLPLCLRRLLRCHPWGTSGWDPVPGCGGASSEAGDRCAGLEEVRHRGDGESDRLAAVAKGRSALLERGGRKQREDR